MTVAKCIYGSNKPWLNKNSLRAIEALKKNEARSKFTGSNKKKRVGRSVIIPHNSQKQIKQFH